MCEKEGLEGVVVLGVDDGVERLVRSAPLDLPGGDEAGVDGVAELGHDHEVGDECGAGLVGLVGAPFGERSEGRGAGLASAVEPCHAPQGRVAVRGRAARREDTYLVALADWARRQLDGLGLVPFEVQAERPAFGEDTELGFEVGAELGVLRLRLGDQVGQP